MYPCFSTWNLKNRDVRMFFSGPFRMSMFGISSVLQPCFSTWNLNNRDVCMFSEVCTIQDVNDCVFILIYFKILDLSGQRWLLFRSSYLPLSLLICILIEAAGELEKNKSDDAQHFSEEHGRRLAIKTLPKAQRTRGLSSYHKFTAHRISIKHLLQSPNQTLASQLKNLKS